MRDAGPAELLLERDRELESLRSVLQDAAGGGGRLALVEGPAGIGKSRLLAELRRAAQEDDVRVLTARGSELEREFPFGVVRQLFEPPLTDGEARERWLAGAAAPARAIFEAADSGSNGMVSDATFAALHGLYWLTANVAADGPLLLSVDDLHWCDRPSLRFLAYLARRLEDMPALVGATLRSTDPGTDPALIAEIGHDPLTHAVRPGPLSGAAVTELVRARLGEDADERFCAACARVTGGNPLLLRQLLSSLEADGVKPDAAHVDVVADIGPRAVSRTVLLRLARLPDDAVSVARAVAVLGESADLPAVAALAEIPEQQVADASGALARAEILGSGSPLGFVHPLVREAIYQELSAGQRELMHARAATILREAGAQPDQVASHLLSMARRGQDWVVELLVEAARSAVRRSAPTAPWPTSPARSRSRPRPSGAARSCSTSASRARTPTRRSRSSTCAEAYELLDDPRKRATAALLLARTLIFAGSPDGAAAFAQRALAELPQDLEDERKALEAVELASVNFGADVTDAPGRLVELRSEPVGDGAGAKMLAAMVAFGWMVDGGPADRRSGASAEGHGRSHAARGRQRALLDGGNAHSCARRPPGGTVAVGGDAGAGAPERFALLAPLGEPLGRLLQAPPGRARGGRGEPDEQPRDGGALWPQRPAGYVVLAWLPRRGPTRGRRPRGRPAGDGGRRELPKATERTAPTSRAAR